MKNLKKNKPSLFPHGIVLSALLLTTGCTMNVEEPTTDSLSVEEPLYLVGYNANAEPATSPARSSYFTSVPVKMVIDGFLMNGISDKPNTEVAQGPLFTPPIVPAGTARLVSFGGADNEYWEWSVYNQVFPLSDTEIETLAQNIVNFVTENGYDGVDVDIEAPGSSYANHNKIINLISHLRTKLDALETAPYGEKYLITIAASHIGACSNDSTNESCQPILDYFGKAPRGKTPSDWLGNEIDVIMAVHQDLDFINVMSYTMVGFDNDDYENLAKASTQSYVDLLNLASGGTDGNRKVIMGIPSWEIMPGATGEGSLPITEDLAKSLAQDAKDQGLYGVFLWTLNYDSSKGVGNYDGKYLGNILTGTTPPEPLGDTCETYTIESGDSWWNIANTQCGCGNSYDTVIFNNSDCSATPIGTQPPNPSISSTISYDCSKC